MRQPDIRCVAAQDRVDSPSIGGRFAAIATPRIFPGSRGSEGQQPLPVIPLSCPSTPISRRCGARRHINSESLKTPSAALARFFIGPMMTAARSCGTPRTTTASLPFTAVEAAIETRRCSPSTAMGFLLPANHRQHATRVYFCCILIKSSTSINRTGVGFVHIRAIRQAFRQRHRPHGFPWFCVFRVCVCVTGFETSRARWPSGKRTWC